MANYHPKLENLKPFKKGKDPRRKINPAKGAFSMTASVKEMLEMKAKDGETYGEKLRKAAILRSIAKSDVLMKEIWDRTDGKVPIGMELPGGKGEVIIKWQNEK